VNTFPEIGFTHEQRLAVLYGADPHYGARLFALIGTLRGWSVQAFSEFEQAVAWLSSEDSPESPAKAEPVPLLKSNRSKSTREPNRPRNQ
jgi:hypothetical protein